MSSHASSDLPDDSDIFQLIMHELTQRANAMQDNLGQPIAIQMALDIFRSYPTMLRSILQQTEKFRQRDFYRNLLKSVLDDIHKQSAAVLAEHYRNIGVGDASSITTAAILCRRLCSSSLPTEPSTWPRYIDVASAEILADERAIIDRAEGMTDQIRLWIDRRLRPSPIAAYKAARAILDQEWRDKCAAQGWGKEHWCRDATEAENGKALLPRKEHSDRETALVTECFPGLNILNPETVDTIPKLWVLIVRTIENAEAELLNKSEEYCAFRPMLETVYSSLHQLCVPWAFSPPYGEVPDHQLKDRLLYIANRLERGEAGVEESDHRPQISATELATKPPAEPTHSADFTSVNWFGTRHQFTKGLQSESVRLLWEAWEKGTPSLSEKTIGDQAGSASDSFRLYHVFVPSRKGMRRRIAHAAWETMIVSTGKGMFALSPPKN